MLKVERFTFNPFQENSYIVYDEKTRECAIFDPGMLFDHENEELTNRIDELKLRPIFLLQTHLHLDHVFGMGFVKEKYGLSPIAHKADEYYLSETVEYSKQFGINLQSEPPAVGSYLDEGDSVKIGNHELDIFHIPGHSPGSIVFYSKEFKFIIGGDVLFHGSIGRTDMPGGSHETLINGIKNKLMVLPDDIVVYSGHGPETTIGQERVYNPFL